MSDGEAKFENTKDSRGWEQLIFGAFDKLANASERFKESPNNVSAAFEWMKGMKIELQDRMSKEFSDRLAQIDWQKLSKTMGDHIAKNYDIEVTAKFSFKPKERKDTEKTHEASEV